MPTKAESSTIILEVPVETALQRVQNADYEALLAMCTARWSYVPPCVPADLAGNWRHSDFNAQAFRNELQDAVLVAYRMPPKPNSDLHVFRQNLLLNGLVEHKKVGRKTQACVKPVNIPANPDKWTPYQLNALTAGQFLDLVQQSGVASKSGATQAV